MFSSKPRSPAPYARSASGAPALNTSSSSSPTTAASSNSNNTNIAKNILKNVESHVRVMSHLENVSISSSYTALRLRRPKGGRSGGGGGDENDDDDSEWSPAFAVSRVHKGVAGGSNTSNSNSQDPTISSSSANASTFAFFSDVVAPCVSNCCAGQSYLFLFTGPQESGRSQTLYGCPPKSSGGRSANPSQDPRSYASGSSAASAAAASVGNFHNNTDSDGNERGVVELTAIDLLDRVHAKHRQRMAAEEAAAAALERGADPTITSAPESDKENRYAKTGGRAAAANNPAAGVGGLTVTFSAFTTRGDQIVDTVTRREVKMEEFPPPLGTVPLPHMQLLDERSIESFSFSSSSGNAHRQQQKPRSNKANGGDDEDGGGASRDVVPILPEKKYIDTSCIIQFQVYSSVDGGGNNTNGMGKRTMATFTFVDVAAFRVPLCREVTCVVDTVRKVAGLTSSSNDDSINNTQTSSSSFSSAAAAAKGITDGGVVDMFRSTRLTQLLEPALTGYVTLVSVATISGRPDLHDGACAALSFSQDIKKIHQVFFLLHMSTPRWLFESGCALEKMRGEREGHLQENYARGVYDYYTTASKWLTNNVSDVEGQLDKLLDETEAVRKGIEVEVQSQETALLAKVAHGEAAVKTAGDAARSVLQEASGQFESVQRLDEEAARLEHRIAQGELRARQRVGEMRGEIAALADRRTAQEREVAELTRNRSLFSGKNDEVVSVLRKYAEDLAFSQVSYSAAHELHAIGRKRRRLEADLAVASAVARRTTEAQRGDRERRSLVARLTTMQHRVSSLRDSVTGGSSLGGFGGGGIFLNGDGENGEMDLMAGVSNKNAHDVDANDQEDDGDGDGGNAPPTKRAPNAWSKAKNASGS